MKLSNSILSGSIYFIIYLFLSIETPYNFVCKKTLELGEFSSAHRDLVAIAHIQLRFCERHNVSDVHKITSVGREKTA